MKESYLWQTLRVGLPRVQWSRVESSAGVGVPDVNGFLDGVELWFELKIMEGAQLRFRQSQVAWISRRLAGGAGNVFVLARKREELRVYPASVAIITPVRVDAEKRLVWIAPGPTAFTLHKPFNWDELWLRAALMSDGRLLSSGKSAATRLNVGEELL